MILQELVNYYESLEKIGDISPLGYGSIDVSYALRIGWDGELLGILTLKTEVERGNRTVEVAQKMYVPEPVLKAAGLASNFLFENGMYLLGLDTKGNKKRAIECFNTASNLHHQLLDDVNHAAAIAITSFFGTWDPEQCETNPILTSYIEGLTAGGNIIFQLPDGQNAHDIQELKTAWEKFKEATKSDTLMQCLVTGKTKTPVARLHNKIKGVRGGLSVGTSIVSFNERAYESYGRVKEQGLNSPISEYASFAYTTALNYLLSSPYRQVYGNTTMVYWAQTGEPEYQNIFESMIQPEEDEGKRLSAIIDKLSKAMPINENVSLNTRFFVLGLSPNAGRLSIRFFWNSSFGDVIKNVAKHYQRLEIEKPSFEKYTYLSPYWLLRETVSPSAKDPSASPLLEGSLMRSILMGLPYPTMLANSVLIRIRAERDINWKKAAILKAWLLNHGQQKTNYQEVLTVSLNRESNNRAYVLGRLFAVLEKAQEEANPGINTTIKDKYFSSACSAPATVFPLILKLSNYHISKAEYGKNLTKQIGELMDRLNVEDSPFPAHLPLEDQAIFILGYYHEHQARFQKKVTQNEQSNNLQEE